jgi:regulator of telomere elongation helicase 1
LIFAYCKVVLKSIEEQLDSFKLDGQDGITKPASFIFEMLEKTGLNHEKKNYIFEILQRLLQYFGAQLPNPRHHNGASLGKFSDFLQVLS